MMMADYAMKFQKADANGDGILSLEEYLVYSQECSDDLSAKVGGWYVMTKE